jgi:hypothetical protein
MSARTKEKDLQLFSLQRHIGVVNNHLFVKRDQGENIWNEKIMVHSNVYKY